MATYSQIYNRSVDNDIAGQVMVAITKEAKYIVEAGTDPDTIDWAVYALGNTRSEAQKWQLTICVDPAVADAESVRDEDVAAAVTALVPTMVKSYVQSRPQA
jgi:hypothetical protein